MMGVLQTKCESGAGDGVLEPIACHGSVSSQGAVSRRSASTRTKCSNVSNSSRKVLQSLQDRVGLVGGICAEHHYTTGDGGSSSGACSLEGCQQNGAKARIELDLSLVQHHSAAHGIAASAATHPVHPLHSNSLTLGRRYETEFREEEIIGKGGFGVVHRAMHHLSDVEFAIKKIRLCGPRRDVESVLREVRTLAKIGSHSHVVRYYNSWIEAVADPVNSLDTSSASFAKAIVQVVGSPLEEEEGACGRVLRDGVSDAYVKNFDRGDVGENSFDGLSISKNKAASTSFNSDECEFSWDRAGVSSLEMSSSASLSEEDSSSALIVTQRTAQAAATGLHVSSVPHDNFILYLQMELCTCATLEDSLKERVSVSPVGSIRILEQVLCAIDWVHSHGIVHRDLKPSNLFISADGTVKLGDFGLAREIGEGVGGEEGVGVDANSAGACRSKDSHTSGVGTHVYASPEQLAGRKITDKADIFSVGVLIVELFHIFPTGMERVVTLSNARLGDLPHEFFIKYPRMASLALQCLSHDQFLRPSAAQLLRNLEGSRMASLTHIPSPAIRHIPSPSISPSSLSNRMDDAWSLSRQATPSTTPLSSANVDAEGMSALKLDIDATVSDSAADPHCSIAKRSLNMAPPSPASEDEGVLQQSRVEELEGMVKELLAQKSEQERVIAELNRKVQWQAGLASALLCTPASVVWERDWKQNWKKVGEDAAAKVEDQQASAVGGCLEGDAL